MNGKIYIIEPDGSTRLIGKIEGSVEIDGETSHSLSDEEAAFMKAIMQPFEMTVSCEVEVPQETIRAAVQKIRKGSMKRADWMTSRLFVSWEQWLYLIAQQRSFHPPEKYSLMQDKRQNHAPLGENTYLCKARKAKNLARSTHTRKALHKSIGENDVKQCKHTFRITAAQCAPCSGYNVECTHYERNDAADTKHRSQV